MLSLWDYLVLSMQVIITLNTFYWIPTQILSHCDAACITMLRRFFVDVMMDNKST